MKNCVTEQHSSITFCPSQLTLSSACAATVDNMWRRRCRVSLLQGGSRKIRSWRACSWSARANAAGKKSHHIWCQWHVWKNHRKQDDCCWFDGLCMCAPHTRCWWRPCRALLLVAAQACLGGTLSVTQPRRGRCAPRPNEPPIPGQIPCKAGRDFLISQSSSKMDLVIQYEAPQMRSYLPHSLSGTPNAEYSNCL